jgi:hypothetical protein
MTATPHNGKEEDFQLFMALLDGDRFEGKFRDGVHAVDVSDLMRRMVKENLLKFDGTPLFPERIARYTVRTSCRINEARLYKEVTDYVREEFNRAEALENDKRAGTVGFALTICSGGSHRHPRRSTNRFAVAANDSRSACASWICCRRGATVKRSSMMTGPCSTRTTSRISKRRPRMRGGRSRS